MTSIEIYYCKILIVLEAAGAGAASMGFHASTQRAQAVEKKTAFGKMKVAPIVRLKLCLYDVWGVKKQSPTTTSQHTFHSIQSQRGRSIPIMEYDECIVF